MFLIPAVLLGITGAQAHGIIKHWIVNGEEKPGFNPSYPPQFGPTAMRPTINDDWGWADYTSGIVACGGNAATDAVQTWDVDAGSTVVAHWDSWPDSHKGPAMEWMAKCPGNSCNGVAADSLDWFKIGEASFDGNEWAGDKISRELDWPFQIPADIAPGAYIIRHEIIALHTPNEPQVYPVCFQANVRGSGSTVPSQTVRFPEAYTRDLKWTTFNLYYKDDPNEYVPPGGPLYSAGPSNGSTPAPAPAPSPSTSSSAGDTAPSPSSSVAAGDTATASSSVEVVPTQPTASSTEGPVNGGGHGTLAPVPEPTGTSNDPTEPDTAQPTTSSGGKGKCVRRRQLKAGRERKRPHKRSRSHA